MQDNTIFRQRQSALADRLADPRHRQATEGATAIFKVFNNGAMPSGAAKFYAAHSVDIAGVESEGSTPTFNAGTDLIPVIVLDGTPVVGDYLIARYIGGRWVAEVRAGSGGSDGTVTIAGCTCTSIPGVLHMSASGPCVAGAFPSCTLRYGPTPPELSGLDLGANCFLSDEVFTDPYVYANYRLHLGCDSVFFRLSRVYLPGTDTNAFHDAPLYTWSIGRAGNTCSPFLLSVGIIFSGGNPNCTVVISE